MDNTVTTSYAVWVLACDYLSDAQSVDVGLVLDECHGDEDAVTVAFGTETMAGSVRSVVNEIEDAWSVAETERMAAARY